MSDQATQDRASYLAAPNYFNLNMACVMVREAFGYHPYLVGSSLKHRNYRDVDVRLILPDDEYRALFHDTVHTLNNAKWSLVCTSIGMYLSQHSDLPVDFQIQMQSKANEDFPLKDHPRNALGVFITKDGQDIALRE